LAADLLYRGGIGFFELQSDVLSAAGGPDDFGMVVSLRLKLEAFFPVLPARSIWRTRSGFTAAICLISLHNWRPECILVTQASNAQNA
jgi:hypothetical protein